MKISSHYNILKNLVEEKKAVVSIIGLGYVGLPLSILFSKNNFRVIGIDIDKNKIKKLKSGKSYIKHIKNNSINEGIKKGNLIFSNNLEDVSKANIIIICLPTPLNQYREPDLSFITSTLKIISPHFKKGQLLILESTSYPGTTEEIIKPVIEENNFLIGDDFFLVYSPEREDPGNLKFKTSNIPKVVGGITKNCLEIASTLYSFVIKEVIQVSNTKTAEMTKLLENIHRAVNIGLVNEIKPLAYEMGIDLYEVIEAAKTKPFGFVPYYPGPGLGGHCIPIDPFYLTWKAKEYGMHTRFIELAGEINQSMPKYVVDKLIDGLNKKSKSINGSKILLLGIAYKKNVDDMRESPALKIISLLEKKGADVSYCDDYFETFPETRKYNFKLKKISLKKNTLESFDAAILVTDHDYFNYDLISKYCKLLVDTRGRFANSKNKNIIRA